MPLPLPLLRELTTSEPRRAWEKVVEHSWNLLRAPLPEHKIPTAVVSRDGELGAIDLFLATAGWDLWNDFGANVPHTSDTLAAWWAAQKPGRAVLILDALSLREAPWLLEGASKRGYTLHQARATAAELPADTTPFARGLGFSSRSSLENNGGSGSGRLPGAKTEALGVPWGDCAAQIDASPDWILWHHWPDSRLHDLGAPGHGLAALAQEAADGLRGDDFWGLIHKLTTGRRLVITADHGYAASGHFPDTDDPAQAQYLKARFKGARWAARVESTDDSFEGFVPPLSLDLHTAHADATFVLGRRKWRSQGGYPTLTHGGLSLLEVLVPFIEISRPGGT